MVRRNLEYAKQIAFSSEETLIFSYECALNMKDTDGDYVECGVAAGAQIIAMATASPNKIIHAFDSFDYLVFRSGIGWCLRLCLASLS